MGDLRGRRVVRLNATLFPPSDFERGLWHEAGLAPVEQGRRLFAGEPPTTEVDAKLTPLPVPEGLPPLPPSDPGSASLSTRRAGCSPRDGNGGEGGI